MREISLFQMKPVYVAGEVQNLSEISKKINEDNIIFSQIEKDYLKDKKSFSDEYINAKINCLKNKHFYGYLILKKYFEDVLFEEDDFFPDYQKLEMRRKGWMIPQQFVNMHIQSSGYADSVEEIYIRHFLYFFDKLFNFDITEIDKVNDAYKQAISNFKNRNYYSCATVLFPIIEFYHRAINKYDKEQFYRIKDHLDSVTNKISNVQQIYDKKIDYYIKLVEQLNGLIKNSYFNSDNRRKIEPEIINRNRLMHGLFIRNVNQKDCLQLFCVISNMVVIKNIIEANKLIISTGKQIACIERN